MQASRNRAGIISDSAVEDSLTSKNNYFSLNMIQPVWCVSLMTQCWTLQAQ